MADLDPVQIDGWVFRLHYWVTSTAIFAASAVAFAKQYFGDPIECIFVSIYSRGCQIGMQGPQLCAEPRYFCKLDVATSRIAFLDLNLHVLQVAPSNSKN